MVGLVEITEATDESDQREMTAFERSGKRVALLGHSGGRFSRGASRPGLVWASDVVKRNEMRFQYSKVRMLASYVADDGLEHFTFIERTNNRRDCIHQLELLSFHIVGEQTSCTGRVFEEAAVELLGESPTEWPERVE